MTSPEAVRAVIERLEQIKAQLAAEWRLKTEQGIHHDHLSDLAFVLAEMEHQQARADKLEAALASDESDELEAEHARQCQAAYSTRKPPTRVASSSSVAPPPAEEPRCK